VTGGRRTGRPQVSGTHAGVKRGDFGEFGGFATSSYNRLRCRPTWYQVMTITTEVSGEVSRGFLKVQRCRNHCGGGPSTTLRAPAGRKSSKNDGGKLLVLGTVA